MPKKLATFLAALAGALAPWMGVDGGASAAGPADIDKQVQQIAASAGPSLVAIRVVRGEPYPKPPPNFPGRLGPYPASDSERLAVQKQPHLHLAHPLALLDGEGVGAIIDSAGLVLTLYHVVRGARKIYVAWDGGGAYADIHAADPRSDLAMLKLLESTRPFKVLAPADAPSSQTLRIGHPLVVLSCLVGQGGPPPRQVVSLGRLVGLHRFPALPNAGDRQLLSQRGFLFQVELEAGPRLSGSAVFTPQGEWLGMTTTVPGTRPGRVLLAQPFLPGVRRLIAVLAAGREVEYGFLGISTEDVSAPQMAAMGIEDGGGVLINEAIAPGLPAALADLRRGDVILSVQGRRVHTGDDLFVEIGTSLAGSAVTLEIVRRRQRVFVKVSLGKLAPLPGVVASVPPPDTHGLQVDYLTTLLSPSVLPEVQAQVLAVLRDGGGVLVRGVLPDSPAARAGLRIHDVILRVNGQAVATPADFLRRMEAARGTVELTLPPLQSPQPPRTVRLDVQRLPSIPDDERR